MADMQELIARLEAADGITHSLEVEFATHLYENQEAFTGLVNYDPEVWLERNESPLASLDAALALLGRVLPAWDWQITKGADEMALACISHSRKVSGPEVCAHTPALALCIAILRAIQHGYEAAGEVSPNLKAKAQGEGG